MDRRRRMKRRRASWRRAGEIKAATYPTTIQVSPAMEIVRNHHAKDEAERDQIRRRYLVRAARLEDARMGGARSGPCFRCGKKVAKDGFCFGCAEWIHSACDMIDPGRMGFHDPDAHLPHDERPTEEERIRRTARAAVLFPRVDDQDDDE